MKCNAFTKSGDKCSNPASKAILADGQIRDLCGPHYDKTKDPNRDNPEFHTGRPTHDEVQPVQQQLIDTTTTSQRDNIRHVTRAREMIISSEYYDVGWTNTGEKCIRCGKPMVINLTKTMTLCCDPKCNANNRAFTPEKETMLSKSLLTLTGHRTNKLRGAGPEIRTTLAFIFKGLKEQYGTRAILGGAEGADTDAAAAALRVDMPYELYLPAGYEDNYFRSGTDKRKKFDAMHSRASNIVRVGSLPFDWRNNFKRNEAMVEATLASEFPFFFAVSLEDPRVVVRNRENGGTNHGIRTMRKMGVEKIYWINPATPTVFTLVNF